MFTIRFQTETKKYAEKLAEILDANVERIDTVVPYPPYGGPSSPVVEQGNREVQAGYCPEIKPLSHNVADYDVVAVGTPTWWYTMAPAMFTFLTSQDWNGKTVIPFMTHGGWPGHVVRDIKKRCNGASFAESIQIQFDSQGGARLKTKESEITGWMERVKEEIIMAEKSYRQQAEISLENLHRSSLISMTMYFSVRTGTMRTLMSRLAASSLL